MYSEADAEVGEHILDTLQVDCDLVPIDSPANSSSEQVGSSSEQAASPGGNPAVTPTQSTPAAEQAPTRPPFQPTTNDWADGQRRLAEAQMTDAELVAAQEKAAQQRAVDPYMDESYGERQRRLAGQ